MKHLLGIADIGKDDIVEIIGLAEEIKKNPKDYSSFLSGKSMVMIFQKTSTRTRLSFEIGMAQLGGHAIYLDWRTSNMHIGDLKDEIKCIGRYTDLLMARVYSHSDLGKMAEFAGVPVINGLSDLEHPCQILADLMTVKEKKKSFGGLKVAFIGDGNNVCNSLIAACSKLGIKLSVANPKGYEPDKGIVSEASEILDISNEPRKAAENADVIYTDTWISLGQEKETRERLEAFKGFQLNKPLVPEGAIVMHCLPAHRGLEITDDVIDSSNSAVFDQAENRLHVQKAIMLKLMGRN